MVTLPPAGDKTVLARLDKGLALWRPLHEGLSAVVSGAVVPGTPATEQIARQVLDIQRQTEMAIQAIDEIAATEVSRSLTGALAGVKEMAHHIAELSGESQGDADGVSARALDELSRMLSETVEQFTV